MKNLKRIAILGGGPAGSFMFKRLVESGEENIYIEIFEKTKQLGVGMPYSSSGACDEHVTNVSANEIPELVTSLKDWIKTVSQQTLERFNVSKEEFNEYKVLPRLLFGEYLEAQFKMLLEKANQSGIYVQVHFKTTVKDVIDNTEKNIVTVVTDNIDHFEFDHAIICTGHNWPKKYEGSIPGYFDSPYPPSKLTLKANHLIAIKGASLTAIDAVKTLARHNGIFSVNQEGKLNFSKAENNNNFKLILHTRNGLLPAVRFHLEDSHLSTGPQLNEGDVNANKLKNDGFLSLDYVFEKFKLSLEEKDPAFYIKIKGMQIEEFVEAMMKLREHVEPIRLLKSECAEAKKSIRQKKSVYWKEMLAVLSFAMNYPAKYFSAEDTLRLKKVLMPLISIVIAFIPQSSVEELLALHNAGVLDIIAVGDESYSKPEAHGGATYYYTDESGKSQSVYYKTYVDCTGQPHLSWKDLPYKSMVEKKVISPAKINFRDAKAGMKEIKCGNTDVAKDEREHYYLNVSGITINDYFQVVNDAGVANERIFMMAVPYIGGYNPDYSGLDFCEAASLHIVEGMFKNKS